MLLGVVAIEVLCRVYKILYSARAIGFQVPFGAAVRTILGGDFAASITPSRSGSEPARFLVLTEAGVPVAGVLLVLFLELFLEMLSLVVVATILGVVMRDAGDVVRNLVATVGLYAAAVLGAGVFALSLAKRRSAGPPPRWARWVGINAGGWRRVQRSLRQLRDNASSLRTAHKGLMLSALGFSIAHVAARLVALPVIVGTYSAGALPALGPLILWPLLLLYGAAVAPAPGGGGLVELAFKASLGGAIPDRLVAAALIWWRVYTFYIYIVIGAISAGRTVMRALQRTSKALESP